MPTTGDRIRELREKRRMTQDQLAKAADISKGFLSDVENNKRNISSQALLRIANCLGASIDYLLRGETKESTIREPVTIPSELSEAAEHLKLSYAETLELLDAHKSVIARRSNKLLKSFTVDDWKKLHRMIKEVFR
jgi:transcriptional regulator with XRE-family HTH domain